MPPCALTDHVDAFLDGDLARAEVAAFEAHLPGCAACADEVTLARRLHAGLRALPAEPCPDDVFDGALARIAALERDRPAAVPGARRAPRWRAVGVGAVLLALLALTVLVVRAPAEAPEAPMVASDTPPTTPAPLAPPVEAVPDAPASPAAAPAPRPGRARPAPEAPAALPAAPQVAEVSAEDGEVVPGGAPAGPSPEAEAARDGALLAFALAADAHHDAQQALRADVGDGLGAVSDALALAFPR